MQSARHTCLWELSQLQAKLISFLPIEICSTPFVISVAIATNYDSPLKRKLNSLNKRWNLNPQKRLPVLSAAPDIHFSLAVVCCDRRGGGGCLFLFPDAIFQEATSVLIGESVNVTSITSNPIGGVTCQLFYI